MNYSIKESNLDNFAVSCMFTTDYSEEHPTSKLHPVVKELWEKSKYEDEFVNKLLKDSSLIGEQFYGVLSKKFPGNRSRTITMLNNAGCDEYNTESDAGSVCVRSLDNSFSVMIPNNYGDCTTTVMVVEEKDKLNQHMMDYTGIVLKGKFMVMDYDCGDEDCGHVCVLDGKYFVYNLARLVVFVKFD